MNDMEVKKSKLKITKRLKNGFFRQGARAASKLQKKKTGLIGLKYVARILAKRLMN
jgi:hypothetical protein